MKILWLINIVLPAIAYELGCEPSIGGGWLVQMAKEVAIYENLVVVFPQNIRKECIVGNISGLKYYGFYESGKKYHKYRNENEKVFKEILAKENPDLLHIWGTEFIYDYIMTKMFSKRRRTIVSIQGAISICAKAYMADLPLEIVNSWTFRDFIRKDNLIYQQKKFKKRGKYEILTMENAGYFVGRTDWDEAVCEKINSSAVYYKCNEILRESFYEMEKSWKLDKCEKYTLFISQGGYPLKGLHKVLEAMAQLIKEYVDIKLYIAGGKDLLNTHFKDKIRFSSYDRYIVMMIRQYNLQNAVVFLGKLTEREMAEQLLKTHVFISASSMENESNSLSEAKLLGVPSVASFAGGTASRIRQGIDGFQYQYEESYMLAYYVKKIFDDDELAERLGKEAYKSESQINCKKDNLEKMLEIYRQVNEDAAK